MPVAVIALIVFSLLFGVFQEPLTVRRWIGISIESGEEPDIDLKIKIEGKKGRTVIRL